MGCAKPHAGKSQCLLGDRSSHAPRVQHDRHQREEGGIAVRG